MVESRVDLAAAFQGDHARGGGAGVTEIQLRLRLRYESSRQFAPYVGVTWRRALGETAGLRRSAGEPVSVSGIVVGIRAWF